MLNSFSSPLISRFTCNLPRTKPDKGGGVVTYLSVDDVDKFHEHLLSKRIKTASKPQDQPWGNREFIVRDPDGYSLAIFKRR